MPVQCWDVVRVDLSCADEPVARPRPALVIATPAATSSIRLVWVLMITSARHAPWPQDVPITDLAAAGLSHPSLIRTAKIATIDLRFVTPIGHLSAPDRNAAATRLKRQLDAALTL